MTQPDTIAQPAPPRGFADAEFEARTRRAQALMHRAGVDALLLMTEPEVRYFTGFLTPFWQSPTRPWFVVVPSEGKPIAVIPEIGAVCMQNTWIDDIRTWPSPRPEDEGITLLVDLFRTQLPTRQGKIGVPMGPETSLRMPLSDFERLRDTVLPAQIVDAGAIIRTLRMVKSEAEVAKIRHICTIASDVFETLPQHLHTGMTEVDIFRKFKTAMLNAGADDTAYLVGGAGPGGYGDIISPPRTRPTQTGDVLILDTGAVFDGYFCDFDRTYAFGDVDDAVKRAHATVYAATEAGLAAARPGTTCAALFHAMNMRLEAGGALGNTVGRLGHGLGMQLTEWPSNTAHDTTELSVGMVITLEPGMTFADGKVMVHEENIVVRDGPPELLSRRAPAEMPIIT